jgi:hypothetical protein
VRGLDRGHGGQRLLDELLGVLVGAGHREVHHDGAAVLGDGVDAGGGIERALDLRDAVDLLQAPHDVLHGGGHLRLAGLDRALALHQHLLPGLLGEAGGLDDHVAALGLAITRRRLVEVVLADLAADRDGEDDEQDPPENGGPAVPGAPAADARCEVLTLHDGLLRRGSYAVREL